LEHLPERALPQHRQELEVVGREVLLRLRERRTFTCTSTGTCTSAGSDRETLGPVNWKEICISPLILSFAFRFSSLYHCTTVS
jgi:hypothetical protein